MQSARNSSMMLEEAYATGVAVLSKYAEQRDRLKVSHGIINRLSFSSTKHDPYVVWHIYIVINTVLGLLFILYSLQEKVKDRKLSHHFWLFSWQRAQRKALDILNTVGLSNTVLKLIERRHRVDKWIAYTGMVITILVVCAFVWWMHWWCSTKFCTHNWCGVLTGWDY